MGDRSSMPTVRIGSVEKEPSLLALGCAFFGGQGPESQDEAQAGSVLAAALRHGINHIDTASSYTGGCSERFLGRSLDGRREQVFLSSKAVSKELTPASFMQQIDGSLERLDTDAIDLYYIHGPPRDGDTRPWMEALVQAKQDGKIGAIGVSNFSVEQMERAFEVGTIDVHQLGYNMIWRFPERDVIPYCREHGIAIATYGSLAQGILTGRFPRDLDIRPDEYRASILFYDDDVWPHVYEGVEALKDLAREVGRPLTHLVLRWMARQLGLATIIVGASRPEQVEQNAAAMASPVADQVLERMTEISDQVMAHMPDVPNIYYSRRSGRR